MTAILDAIYETLWEFQAGPRQTRRRQVKRGRPKLKQPKWMELRARRLPIKKEKFSQIKQEKKLIPKREKPRLKRDVTKLRRPLPKVEPKKLLEIKRERAIFNTAEPEEEKRFEAKDSGLNDAIEAPQERVQRIESAAVKKKVRKNRQFYETVISKKKRHMLFMNPGTKKIMEARDALTSNNMLPAWAIPFENQLTMSGGGDDDEKLAEVPILLFEGLQMATTEEKRDAVKRQYFDPKGFSTILPITDKLRETYANITKGDVQRILRSLETYQRNFARRRPPRVMGRMILKNPGIIAMDMFFPTKKIAGWEGKWSCLTCMDCWSRYCHAYALPNKKFVTVEAAMTRFLQDFASFGFPPRRILSDKGTDMAAAKTVMEKYRMQKDGNRPMVVHTQTAQPVNIVEAMNSEFQRRMQVFRTSALTDDPSVLLEDISYSINHQKRPTRGNLSPIQLLSLNEAERKRVNDMWDDRNDMPEVQGLRPLHVGNSVRILLMSKKEQAANTIKGFTAKWSTEVYTVLKKVAIPRNRQNYRYFVGTHQSYFRHELLKIAREVDTETFDMVSREQVYVAPEEAWSDLDYDSDDSRA